MEYGSYFLNGLFGPWRWSELRRADRRHTRGEVNYARHLRVSGNLLVNLGIFFRISSLVSKTILKMPKLDMENKHQTP